MLLSVISILLLLRVNSLSERKLLVTIITITMTPKKSINPTDLYKILDFLFFFIKSLYNLFKIFIKYTILCYALFQY